VSGTVDGIFYAGYDARSALLRRCSLTLKEQILFERGRLGVAICGAIGTTAVLVMIELRFFCVSAKQ
jgi:hypothetical protein